MIKATATRADGRSLILLGLENGNIKLLKRGRPIYMNGLEYGWPVDVSIVYGDNQKKIIKYLRDQGFELPPESAWIRDSPKTTTRN